MTHTIDAEAMARGMVDRHGHVRAMSISATWMDKMVGSRSFGAQYDYWGRVYGSCNDMLTEYLSREEDAGDSTV
jgi:hypothetical protein